MTMSSTDPSSERQTASGTKTACSVHLSVVKCPMPPDELIPTRATLLARLKDAGADASWNESHQLYPDLIFSTARRCGLNEHEAREAVQDTLISVAKKMPGFTYDPGKDSFKGWLLMVTRWRIRDQLAKRAGRAGQDRWSASPTSEDESAR